jgi:hypothetical protein
MARRKRVLHPLALLAYQATDAVHVLLAQGRYNVSDEMIARVMYACMDAFLDAQLVLNVRFVLKRVLSILKRQGFDCCGLALGYFTTYGNEDPFEDKHAKQCICWGGGRIMGGIAVSHPENKHWEALFRQDAVMRAHVDGGKVLQLRRRLVRNEECFAEPDALGAIRGALLGVDENTRAVLDRNLQKITPSVRHALGLNHIVEPEA